jgi:hypothetical protein
LDSAESFSTVFKRTRLDLAGCIASAIDASAVLIFQLFLAAPGTGPRLCIMLFIDPVTCLIGYWAIYQRVRHRSQKLAELGFYLLILGTIFALCESVLEESAILNLMPSDSTTAGYFQSALISLFAATYVLGLVIDTWLIATSPAIRRWLGLMLSLHVVLVLVTVGGFFFQALGSFADSLLFTGLVTAVTVSKAIWLWQPVGSYARPKADVEPDRSLDYGAGSWSDASQKS